MTRARRPVPGSELAELRARLAEAQDTLRAIGSGEVDAVVVPGEAGPKVFTLEGADHGYRVLIESMNEGALTLSPVKLILYANACFARMVKCPLQQVIGGSLRRFLSDEDRAALRRLLPHIDEPGSKVQVLLQATDGSRLPTQISIRRLAKSGRGAESFGLVVTDMTEARRNEELLRALFNRSVHANEAERGRLALDLHDRITQLLCAVLFRSEALAAGLSTHEGPAKEEARKLRRMLGEAAEELERVTRKLRPGAMVELGVVAGLRSACREFSGQTDVPVEVACVELTARLPADTELALYRILEEALENVRRHARATRVAVTLTQPDGVVELSIADDGVGFDTNGHAARRKSRRGLGLVSMAERATFVGGALSVASAPGEGTTIRVKVPHAGAGAASGGVTRRPATRPARPRASRSA